MADRAASATDGRPGAWGAWVVAAVLAGFLGVGLVAWPLQASLVQQRALARAGAENVARLLDEALTATLDRADLTLQAVADEHVRERGQGTHDPQAMQALLDRLRLRSPDLTSLGVLDETGRVVTRAPPLAEPVSLSDHAFFRAVRDDAPRGLYVSRPYVGRLVNRPIITVARRLTGPDGSFEGVASAVIELSRLEALISRIDVGAHGTVTVLWEDLSFVVRRGVPGQRQAFFGEIAVSPELHRLVAEGHASGTYVANSGFDGERRTFSFRKVAWQPLYVIGALAERDYLAQWRRQAIATCALIVGFLGVAAAAARLGWKGWHRRLDYERQLREEAEQRARLREQLLQSQKLESVGRLAGGVAHDFNNLLTVILSCAEGLQEALDRGAPPPADDVRELRAAGDRARELTRQLLTFARKGSGTPVLLDLNAALHGAEKLLRRVLGEDVELRVAPAPALWPVRCDPGQIDQVLMNLAVNARDAMPEGGVLELSTANVEPGAPGPAQGTSPDGWVRLTVRDSGVGMSAEVQRHLFEPFFTTKAEGQGTGLGLATVYGIVAQAGGQVTVVSAPARGATFELWFPRATGAVARAPAPAAARAPRGTESVLLVEDEPSVRLVAARALRDAGYRVSEAESAEEVLSWPAERLDGVALLVTDVVMPGVDGPALADALRARRPGLGVLFVSGYPPDRLRRPPAGAREDFLAKPFSPADLLRRARALLDGGPAPASGGAQGQGRPPASA